ncbi:hypothetical protein ACFPME_09900 [Rhodanobacter umsongensis]|uniref:Uncharacterized protein n=1 Tax=Rhodanobacter umsongensis TaxID=633153 RepID=A0ABW0JLC2_9GAMM
MSFFANDLMGASIIAPSTRQMSALLHSLASADNEHPDVSLGHESGWCISAFSSGLTVFENVETGEGPMHMRGVAPERVLELWSMLAAGDISGLDGLAWTPGYGT